MVRFSNQANRRERLECFGYAVAYVQSVLELTLWPSPCGAATPCAKLAQRSRVAPSYGLPAAISCKKDRISGLVIYRFCGYVVHSLSHAREERHQKAGQ